MKMKTWRFDLALTHTWTIASSLKPDGSGGKNHYPTVFVELTDNGLTGIGESAPSTRYNETADTTEEFLKKVDAERLSFEDIAGSMKYLDRQRRAGLLLGERRHQHRASRWSGQKSGCPALRFSEARFSRRGASHVVHDRH
jgi:hypothetical protein